MTKVPFSDPPWLMGMPSPYYNESHRKWQQTIRPWIQENLHKNALEWDTQEILPESVFKKFAANGMLIPSLPAPLPVEWLKRLGINEIMGLKVEDFDYTHMSIYSDEVCNMNLLYTPVRAHTCIDGSIWARRTQWLPHNWHVLWCSSHP
jgi:acyl-CoA dehydrogenase